MIKTIIEKTWCIFMTAVIIWFGISYTEIVCKNLREDPQYWNGNAIILMCEYIKPIR